MFAFEIPLIMYFSLLWCSVISRCIFPHAVSVVSHSKLGPNEDVRCEAVTL